MKSLKSILAVVVATVGLVSCTSVQPQEENVREAYTLDTIYQGMGIAHLESLDFQTIIWAYPSTKDSIRDVCIMLQVYLQDVMKEVDKKFAGQAPIVINSESNEIGGFWDNQKGMMPSQSFSLTYIFDVQFNNGQIVTIKARLHNYNYDKEIELYAYSKKSGVPYDL